MAEEVVRTGVDDLLDLLGGISKIALAEAAQKLKIDAGTIQAWVDFLVEEGIVGIEYKFTTPFIYLNKGADAKKDVVEQKEENVNIQYFKKQFFERAKSNNIPETQIESLWKHHLTQGLELQKKYFMFEAQRRKLPRSEELWNEYKELVLYS